MTDDNDLTEPADQDEVTIQTDTPAETEVPSYAELSDVKELPEPEVLEPVVVEQFDTVAPEEKPHVERVGVTLGRVIPGQVGEDSFLLMRLLAGSDSGDYNGGYVAEVIKRVRDHNEKNGTSLDDSGVVDGPVWAVVLPEIWGSANSHLVAVLRSALDLEPGTDFDADLITELRSEFGQETNLVTREIWAHLL